MHTSIWSIIASTPWWVYVIDIGIVIALINLFLSVKQPQIISLKRLFLFPGLLLVVALVYLGCTTSLTFLSVTKWAAALCLGLALGWLHFWWLKVKAIKEASQLYIPGSMSLVGMVFLLFLLQFFYSSQINLSSFLTAQTPYSGLILLLSGLFTGTLIGRLLYSLRCLKTGPYHSPNSPSH